MNGRRLIAGSLLGTVWVLVVNLGAAPWAVV